MKLKIAAQITEKCFVTQAVYTYGDLHNYGLYRTTQAFHRARFF